MLRASGRKPTPAQVPEKRGLKWHSDKSLVDVKDITSHDFDKDFVVAFPFARLRGSAPILAPVHPISNTFLLNLCTRLPDVHARNQGLATAAGRKGATGILKDVKEEEEPSTSQTTYSMNSMSRSN